MFLVGMVAMLVVCATAMFLGRQPQRALGALTAICWTITAACLLLAKRHAASPFYLGDVLFGAGLLVLLLRYRSAYLWIAFALQAMIYMLETFFAPDNDVVTYRYMLTSNVFNLANLAVLLVCTLVDLNSRCGPLNSQQ